MKNRGNNKNKGNVCKNQNFVVFLLLVVILLESYKGSGSLLMAGCSVSLAASSSLIHDQAVVEDKATIAGPTGDESFWEKDEPITTIHSTEQLSREPSRAKVGICAIVKDSSRYIDEWADYNLLALEFTHMFLYDNNDNFVLGPWAERRRRAGQGGVTAIHMPGRDTDQVQVYNQCMKTHGYKVDYMTFLDDDEFLVLYHHDRVADFLDDYLVPGSSLSINWKLFGSSNKTDYAPLPVTYRYQYSRRDIANNVKVFVRPKDWLKMLTAHSVLVKKEDRASDVVTPPEWRDTSRQPQQLTKNGVENEARPHDVAVIHHYKFKSKEEWHYKSCIRQDVSTPNQNSTRNCGSKLHPGAVHDDTAWQFLKRKVPKYAMFEQFEDYSHEV